MFILVLRNVHIDVAGSNLDVWRHSPICGSPISMLPQPIGAEHIILQVMLDEKHTLALVSEHSQTAGVVRDTT